MRSSKGYVLCHYTPSHKLLQFKILCNTTLAFPTYYNNHTPCLPASWSLVFSRVYINGVTPYGSHEPPCQRSFWHQPNRSLSRLTTALSTHWWLSTPLYRSPMATASTKMWHGRQRSPGSKEISLIVPCTHFTTRWHMNSHYVNERAYQEQNKANVADHRGTFPRQPWVFFFFQPTNITTCGEAVAILLVSWGQGDTDSGGLPYRGLGWSAGGTAAPKSIVPLLSGCCRHRGQDNVSLSRKGGRLEVPVTNRVSSTPEWTLNRGGACSLNNAKDSGSLCVGLHQYRFPLLYVPKWMHICIPEAAFGLSVWSRAFDGEEALSPASKSPPPSHPRQPYPTFNPSHIKQDG